MIVRLIRIQRHRAIAAASLIAALSVFIACTGRGMNAESVVRLHETSQSRVLPADAPLSPVSFACMERTPTDEEIGRLIDDAVNGIIGPKGFAAIMKRGDRVVIKVNMVGPMYGRAGEKGRAVITDPRVTRYVAEKVRGIIGNDGTIIVTDALFYGDRDPSDKTRPTSFHHAYLDRNHDGRMDANDVCYDFDADGYLDGSSRARLVNLDAIPESERFLTVVEEPVLGRAEVPLPKFLRTREQARDGGEYCDAYIGLPVFKSHGFTGITGALKLHYGLTPGVVNRAGHAGYGWGSGNIQLLLDWLCALNRARPFDLVIMDALTGNRKGPLNGQTIVNAYDYPTDWIETNAILCSRDPAAIDTVETLFAGYSPSSVPLLESAFRDGIGMTRPGYVDLPGFDGFFRHKEYLRSRKGGTDAGRYPFADTWGNARTHGDFSPPTDLSFDITRSAPYRYELRYSARESLPTDTGLARVEVIVNGKRIRYAVTDHPEGIFDLDLRAYARRGVRIGIAAWDNALNCALSEEKNLVVR